MTKEQWNSQLFEQLDKSKFRSSFHLKPKDIDYLVDVIMKWIKKEFNDFKNQ